MAWVTKYQGGWQSQNIGGYVYIKEQDYAGAIIPVKIKWDSLIISYLFNGWENPFIGINAQFSIVNDKDDFFDLMELMTSTERQFQILITKTTPSSQTLFFGYISCENTEQKYLNKQELQLVGSSYLSKLQYIFPAALDVVEKSSFLDIIIACLLETGDYSSVYVNCHLYATGDALGTTKTLFNMCGVNNEIFWKDNIDKDTGEEVVKKILTAFDCYMYWFDGKWYIERYADIWNNPQNYVYYSMEDTFGPDDAGIAAQTTDSPVEFSSQIKMNQFQSIGIIQGMKEVDVEVFQQWMANLIINDFGDDNLSACAGGVPSPDYRAWMYWADGGYFDYGIAQNLNGKPHKNISNSIYRVGNGIALHRGLYTRFDVTVSPDTSLSITFKFATRREAVGWEDDIDWSRWEFQFNWYLHHSPSNDYIVYDEDTGRWNQEFGTEETKLQTTVVQGTQFDPNDLTVEVSLTIPLGECGDIMDSSGGTSDETFVFGLCTEYVVDHLEEAIDGPCLYAYYGDVVITASGDLENNYHKGIVNTDFINKIKIDLFFSDVTNLNLKNGIWRASDLAELTQTWEDGVYTGPLVNHKIRDKFRLYNVSRQKLVAQFNMGTSDVYKPFRCFTDSNQADKYFVMVGSIFNPMRDQLEVLLMEYDNQETITIA